jgi:AcrR family transcriptional regulator
MQVKKPHVKEKILEIAKQEFMQLGYSKTSLRNIAKKMNCTTGVIYTYFASKEEILTEILTPLLNIAIEFADAVKKESILVKYISSNDVAPFSGVADNHLSILFDLRDEILILVHKSAGSKYENFQQEIIEYVTNGVYDQLNDVFQGKQISKFTLFNLFNFLSSSINQLILENIEREKAIGYLRENVSLILPGWMMLHKNIKK